MYILINLDDMISPSLFKSPSTLSVVIALLTLLSGTMYPSAVGAVYLLAFIGAVVAMKRFYLIHLINGVWPLYLSFTLCHMAIVYACQWTLFQDHGYMFSSTSSSAFTLENTFGLVHYSNDPDRLNWKRISPTLANYLAVITLFLTVSYIRNRYVYVDRNISSYMYLSLSNNLSFLLLPQSPSSSLLVYQLNNSYASGGRFVQQLVN